MPLPLLLPLALLGCSPAPNVPNVPNASNEPTEANEPPAPVAAGDLAGLWVLQIRRATWHPRDLEFVLRIEPDGSGTATLDPVFIGRTTALFLGPTIDGDRVRFTLSSRMDDVDYYFDGHQDGGTLDGVVRWNDGEHEQTEPFTGYRREVRRFDTTFDRFPVEADPRKVGVEPVLLDRLVLGAETARSDGLLVLADGKLLAGRTFGGEDDVASVGSLPVEIAVLAGGESDDPDAQRLRPSDLAALGQALVDGKWTGEPVVSEPWRQALALPAVDGAPGAPWAVVSDPNDGTRAPIGFKHVTDQGEGLLFFPEAHLVVVRTMHRVENGYDRRYDRRDGMEWLDEMSEAIVVEKLGLEPRHK